MSLIDITDLTVRYAGRKEPTLESVSLQLYEGETVLLLGASGSGKSTLALTLNGLIPNSLPVKMSGNVVVAGLDTQEVNSADIAQKVGIVFQDPEAQFVALKVEDEIVFGLENLQVAPETMSATVDDALAQVDMLPYRLQQVDRLSGGQKQRIALASLLAMRPSTLIFDEPTANLDPAGTRDVFDLLTTLKAHSQHTLILIEHKLDDLMHLIDRVIVLGDQGAIVADAPPRQLFRDQAEQLTQLGVWMPQVSRLAHQLDLSNPFPITLDEAETALKKRPFPPPITGNCLPITENAPIIEVKNLSFSYGTTPILDNISLSVPQSDFLAIVGANGAGKTTLAQLMMTILPPPRGTVQIKGEDATRIRSKLLSRQIGYVFQNPEHQFITPTVFEEVAYGLRVLEDDDVDNKAMALLKRFGLIRYAKSNPFTLSHGEKRRLSVATMLAMGQEILILDEPTFGQDQKNAEAIMELLADLNRNGRSIIIITHDMPLVATYAKSAAVLKNGRLRFHGTTRALFAQPDLLTEARLMLPPLAQLGRQIGRSDLLTLEDWKLEIGN
ncbi:MAG: energy-coupling factor transporter ATPase [Chloroflexota bacterium]